MDKSHPTAAHIHTIVSETATENGTLGDVDQLAEKVSDRILKYLDEQKLLYYADPKRVQILNNNGRVLLAIIEDPGITQRALSVYLRVSESNVQKSVTSLLKDGIITKQKDRNRNIYRFNPDVGLEHPDVARLLKCLGPSYSELLAKQKMPRQSQG